MFTRKCYIILEQKNGRFPVTAFHGTVMNILYRETRSESVSPTVQQVKDRQADRKLYIASLYNNAFCIAVVMQQRVQERIDKLRAKKKR